MTTIALLCEEQVLMFTVESYDEAFAKAQENFGHLVQEGMRLMLQYEFKGVHVTVQCQSGFDTFLKLKSQEAEENDDSTSAATTVGVPAGIPAISVVQRNPPGLLPTHCSSTCATPQPEGAGESPTAAAAAKKTPMPAHPQSPGQEEYSLSRNMSRKGSASELCPKQEEQLEAIAQHITRDRPPRGVGVDLLLDYNQEWSRKVHSADPDFFKRLSKVQNPQYLWIGCSDSRVPANQIVGLAPGEVFVHRNVANVVARSDLNCLSVIQFAVEHLKVEHIIVCGHYNCGGVIAAHTELRLGLVDNWINHVSDVKQKHLPDLQKIAPHNQVAALCELNVINQMANVVDTHFIRDYWKKEGVQNVSVHGWIYGLDDGLVKPLTSVSKEDNLKDSVEKAVEGVLSRWVGRE